MKEQVSSWEKEEKDLFALSLGNRQTLTKVHCKVPYRTYERRAMSSWSRRIQEVEEHSDDEADDDDDSDSSPPILTKAHAMLTAKRKVTLLFGIQLYYSTAVLFLEGYRELYLHMYIVIALSHIHS